MGLTRRKGHRFTSSQTQVYLIYHDTQTLEGYPTRNLYIYAIAFCNYIESKSYRAWKNWVNIIPVDSGCVEKRIYLLNLV